MITIVQRRNTRSVIPNTHATKRTKKHESMHFKAFAKQLVSDTEALGTNHTRCKTKPYDTILAAAHTTCLEAVKDCRFQYTVGWACLM
ncbi:hypothetical protein FHS27_003369 [Rhodopirellula rubra]|uniref:Uncharacterized protein n=1 Tax=Aporhodopirellula rubra TaxID=980271 RepID=A0A7W5E0G8_9BACT|nr:hypothetical protein [Aporhodopirellula rubra]